MAKFAHQLLFLGRDASNTLISQFVGVVRSIPISVLKSRLEIMQRQELPNTVFDIPVIYIQAKNDRLLPDIKRKAFSHIFNNIKNIEIEGPHFILQTKPKEAALLVTKFIQAGEF